MNRVILSVAWVLVLLFVAGCGHVASASHTDNQLTGDAWYVKEIRFAGVSWNSRVFYCPKPGARGPARCFEARLHEEGTAAPSGAPAASPTYQQPAPTYQQPAPVYQQPAPAPVPAPAYPPMDSEVPPGL